MRGRDRRGGWGREALSQTKIYHYTTALSGIGMLCMDDLHAYR